MTRQSNAWFVKTGLIICICLLAATTSPAVSLVWDPAMDGSGSGGIGTWDTVTLPAVQNWYDVAIPGDVAWSAGSDAVFGGVGGLVTVSTPSSAGVSVNNLTFNVDGYTIAGDPLNLTAAPTVTVTNAADTATISAVLSQPGTATPNPNTFTKSGSGKLVISNPASVIDGRFTINAGEVVFAGSHTYTDATSPVVSSEVIGNSASNAILTLASGAVFNSNVGGCQFRPQHENRLLQRQRWPRSGSRRQYAQCAT